MPRGPRIEVAGGVHHVTARAPYGRVLFVDDEDRVRWLRLLAEQVVRHGWRVLTYCLMTNHLHLLVQTPQANLGVGMKALHGRFATELNRRHRQHGHVFGGRFANRIVDDDRHLLGCLRYIARNPVAAGLCAAPGDWVWSGHRALLGLPPDDGVVDAGAALSFLGRTRGAARIAYQQLVAPPEPELTAAAARKRLAT